MTEPAAPMRPCAAVTAVDEAATFPTPAQRRSLTGRVRAVSAPVWALAGLMLLYIAVFGTLTWRQQSNFGTFGFDLGVYDQVVWLLSRFKAPFITVRGLNLFGFHVNLILLLLAPFYWLGAGAHFLLVVQTVWIALGAVPLWLLTRDRLGSPWMALVPAGAWLAYPAIEWINWWHFHPDALIATPLMFAYWLATRRRWGWFTVAAVVALLCKEDAALAFIVLGLLIAWRADKRVGLVTAAASAAWFVTCTRAILPNVNGVGPFYETLFPGFGKSIFEIAWNIVRHPSRLINVAGQGDRPTYYRQLLAPLAFLPLLAIPVLLIAGPQLLTNVISAHSYTHQIKYHYSTIPAAVLLLATVESFAVARGNVGVQRFLVGLVAATSLASNVAWSPSPLSVKFHSGIWAERSQPRHRTINEALARVPGAVGVSTTYYLVPHLDHRVHIYEWPNPWTVSNWGVNGENPPNPTNVSYLVLDTTLNGSSQPLYQRLVGPGGNFRVVFEQDGIVVARKRS